MKLNRLEDNYYENYNNLRDSFIAAQKRQVDVDALWIKLQQLVNENIDLKQQNSELLEEIKGRDGIIGKVIDERDSLENTIIELKNANREITEWNKELQNKSLEV